MWKTVAWRLAHQVSNIFHPLNLTFPTYTSKVLGPVISKVFFSFNSLSFYAIKSLQNSWNACKTWLVNAAWVVELWAGYLRNVVYLGKT